MKEITLAPTMKELMYVALIGFLFSFGLSIGYQAAIMIIDLATSM